MKIGIIGVTGRMGKMLSDLIVAAPDLQMSGGISSRNSIDDIEKLAADSDVLVDFSSPSGTLTTLEVASKFRVPFVSGVTGLSDENWEQIRACSATIPVLQGNNFSVGIHLMAALLRKCSEVLADSDVCIVDKHHRHKKDSPSGTAMLLANQVKQKAQIVSIRAGNIAGDHICDFVCHDEMLSISHRAFSRSVFAKGALDCARWIVSQPPGIYTPDDCFGLNFNIDHTLQ
jgi:4-hydroxy-tetrahydrodipicolinate reductase